MRQEIVHATGRAPLYKAPEPDLIVGESLGAASEIHGEFLAELWTACGRIAYTPKIWNINSTVPIFKKGDTEDPANYRLIALLSHARKVIHSAIVSEVRRLYKFHSSQYGFQRGIGTDAAILRATDLMEEEFKYCAILDLKSAYDKVPRDKLAELLSEMLPPISHGKHSRSCKQDRQSVLEALPRA